MQTGKARITGRLRIISQPKIDPAVGGKEDRIARDEVIMQPARRGADEDAGEKQDHRRSFRREQ